MGRATLALFAALFVPAACRPTDALVGGARSEALPDPAADGGEAGAATCGDGKRTGSEACDGADLGATTCESIVARGWVGKLTCRADCSVDDGACAARTDSLYRTLDAPGGWHLFRHGTIHADAGQYRGAAYDGKRYVYFVPYENATGPSSLLLQYDTQVGFKEGSAWKPYDIAQRYPGLKGFAAAARVRSYIYFVPFNSVSPHGRVARYDTDGALGASESWRDFNMTSLDVRAVNYSGAVFDGRYVYFVPTGGVVVRHDTTKAFDEEGAWTHYALTDFDARAKGFSGGAFDGRYVYFAPGEDLAGEHGYAVRYDTTKDFRAPPSWERFDLAAVAAAAKGYHGAVFDDTYVYFVPGSGNGLVVRHDPKKPFASAGSWETMNTAAVAPKQGYRGGVFDGRYVYFVPYNHDGSHGHLVRYNKELPFKEVGSWEPYDLTRVDGGATGLYGAVFDGQYLYISPGTASVALRFDAKRPPWLPRRWSASFF